MIKTSRKGDRYTAWVESEDGKRLSRVYESKVRDEAYKRALKRLQQIEWFKDHAER